MELKSVRGIADGFSERSDHRPRAAPAHRLVLPRGDGHALRRMLDRRMVHVLAHIEFIEPHRAVVGDADVLGVDQIAGDRFGPGVFEFHVPEPRLGRLRQHQSQAESKIAPRAAGDHAVPASLIRGRAARP